MKHWLERLLVVLVAFIGYTVADVMASGIWEADIALYQFWFLAWQTSLLTLCVVIGIAYRSFTLPLSLLILAWNGAEDALYYVLQNKLIPESLPWLTSPLVLQPATVFSTQLGLAWGLLLLLTVSRIRVSLLKFRIEMQP